VDLSFYPLTLEALDQAQAESLCLFVGQDERPLRGLAGLVDWRLAGGLSRFLRSGLVTGQMGDALLTMAGPRLGFEKLFIFGMGGAGQGEEELAARLADGLRRLAAAGVRAAAFDLPAGLSVDVGVRTLVDEREGPPKALVFGPDPGALVTALAHAATRGTDAPVVERRVVKVPGPPRPTPLGPTPSATPTAPTLAKPTVVNKPHEPNNHRGGKKRRR
jgi:hypothetical protein